AARHRRGDEEADDPRAQDLCDGAREDRGRGRDGRAAARAEGQEEAPPQGQAFDGCGHTGRCRGRHGERARSGRSRVRRGTPRGVDVLSWLANAWRVPELRRRVLFTAAVLALYRLGSWIPAPGIDQKAIEQYFSGSSGGILTLLNLFSG